MLTDKKYSKLLELIMTEYIKTYKYDNCFVQ